MPGTMGPIALGAHGALSCRASCGTATHKAGPSLLFPLRTHESSYVRSQSSSLLRPSSQASCLASGGIQRTSLGRTRTNPATTRRTRVLVTAASSSSSAASSAGGGKNSRWDPLLANSDVGCPVPPEQQPVNEYGDLADALFFSWANMGPFNLSVRLGAIGLFFTVAVGWPIACASFDPQKQALQCVLSAIGGGLFPVSMATLRLYLGWQYVGSRLSSATVEYEETGWYDGQVWVKTPELLARDRLLSSYRVKPVLKKLQNILIGLGTSTALIVTLVTFLPSYAPKAEPRPFYFDDVEVESEYFVNIIRAEEKPYNSEAVDAFEADSGEDSARVIVETRASRTNAAVLDLYKKMHAAPELEELDSDAKADAELAAAVSFNAQGYGFEYLVGSTNLFDEEEEEGIFGDDSLFSRGAARSLAQEGGGFANVTIIATRRAVIVESEDSYTAIPGTEDLYIAGSGVSSSDSPSASKTRISDHLGVGVEGQLKVLKSLQPQ